MSIEFKAWPKIPRLFRECIITEKIDGTNAAVGIEAVPYPEYEEISPLVTRWLDNPEYGDGLIAVYAQSRKRIITPAADNLGFAQWVYDNALSLSVALGQGLHFGEWWGSGIGRGYGLEKGEKRFSLFNVERYKGVDFEKIGDADPLPNVGLVPELYRGPFSTWQVEYQVELLRHKGSAAVPGFMKPEGVITFHVAANMVFKTTLEGDEKPKGSNELG